MCDIIYIDIEILYLKENKDTWIYFKYKVPSRYARLTQKMREKSLIHDIRCVRSKLYCIVERKNYKKIRVFYSFITRLVK